MTTLSPPTQRLQGTDGIRGRTQSSESCSVHNPILAYTELGVLTDSFFELYTYVFCRELIHSGFANPGDSIVIGWDPRDREGVFSQAAIRGIQKSGLTVLTVGVLPTPAIALYLLHAKAKCAFVLTASHNPSDQNGIKIFLGALGLKLFPADDQIFSDKLFQFDWKLLAHETLQGKVFDRSEEASDVFIEFSLSKFNSWLSPTSFDRITLVVDAANGAFSKIIQKIFEELPVERIIYTNVDFNQEINKNSGVADLEGVARIPADMIVESTGRFANYDTLVRLLDEGRRQRTAIKSGSAFCTAVVFDGDGDRYFRLDYDAFEDDLIVLSGDKLAFLQAQYLKDTGAWGKTVPLYVDTVESDMESSRAVRKMGFESRQSAVGDKWILWQAFLADWTVRSRFYREALSTPKFVHSLEAFELLLSEMIHSSNFEALKIVQAFKKIESLYFEEGGSKLGYISMRNELNQLGSSQFLIGCEESGHIITMGFLNSGGIYPIYIGNGLKSALNSFSAIENLRPADNEDFYKWLHKPFEHGFHKSDSIYYVDSDLMNPDSEFRKMIVGFISDQIKSKWPGNSVRDVYRSEEPNMIYFLVEEDDKTVASIFLRNSGTEDKMSLYLRGRMKDQTVLNELSEQIYRYILPRVKDLKKIYAQAELLILKQLGVNALSSDQIKIVNDLEVSLVRLLSEMNVKQKLIQSVGQLWNLSERGKILLKFSERSENINP
ncbi:MAG: hypothetical protein HQM13_14830 [SAR324 cluster bacterium]|nr:hypothetical protein [SAR324 cluster bacterium]